MPDRFPWTVSTYPEGSSLVASCNRSGCGGYRYLPRAYLLETVGDIALLKVEARVRCVEPGCNSAMTLEWVHRPGKPEATASSVAQAEELAAFAERMGARRPTNRS